MLYRIKFEKTGLAKYISHLDLNRLFIRAINRAGIKIAYSEGFNPHPKITFASTLSLGISSCCEFADIKCEAGETTAENIFESLSRAMPDNINIKEVYIPESAFKNISSTQYYIFINLKGADIDTLRTMFEENISIEKKSKTKTEQVIINKYITNINFSDNCDGYIKIDAILKTSSELYLNPEYIVKAIDEKFKIDDYFIVKINMFDNTGENFR